MQMGVVSRLQAWSSTRTLLTQRVLHLPLAQSSLVAQARSSWHGLQPLPQSTSLSLPFFTPSSQRAGAQACAEQTPLLQSAPLVHSGPVAHAGQLPPQSTPVSSPFWAKSLQVGFAQTCWVQTPLWQLAPTQHDAFATHG